MTELTAVQKANRAYYQANKDKIRAKKRARYADKIKDKPPAPDKPKGIPFRIKKPGTRSAVKPKVSEEKRKEKQLRWLIEDYEFLRRAYVDDPFYL